jgi:hypothetical protein
MKANKKYALRKLEREKQMMRRKTRDAQSHGNIKSDEDSGTDSWPAHAGYGYSMPMTGKAVALKHDD